MKKNTLWKQVKREEGVQIKSKWQIYFFVHILSTYNKKTLKFNGLNKMEFSFFLKDPGVSPSRLVGKIFP